MDQSFLPDIRKLVSNGSYYVTGHASERIQERSLRVSTVKTILTSANNQVIEIQPPTAQSRDERILICDQAIESDVIVVVAIYFIPSPSVRIVTVERKDDSIWEDRPGEIPCLRRIGISSQT